MARRFYQLPSLTGLNTFESCARHGSFTAAAQELGVTLGAVSRQVKALENELETTLFLRRHRGVELTAEGLDLFQVLSSGFQQIGRLCRDFKHRAQRADVTLGATTALASLWLKVKGPTPMTRSKVCTLLSNWRRDKTLTPPSPMPLPHLRRGRWMSHKSSTGCWHVH